MSKYIIFSDIHLHTYSGEINQEFRISQRLLDQKDILQQLINFAIEQDAMILNGGDIFHAVGAVPTEALNVYSWFINECKNCGIKYYTATGNHDLSIRKNNSAWHNVLSLFQETEQRNKELLLLKPTIKFVDYDDDDFENINGWDIVILHKQPEITNKHGFKHEGVNWQKLAKRNRLSFYGHYHHTKQLSKMVYIIGQPLQMTQADVDEERGCWLVDSETWSVTFKKLNYPELKKIEVIESKEEKFEERIKATSFQDILLEWLNKEGKPQSYLDLIQNDIPDKSQTAKNIFTGKIKSIYLKDFLSVKEITITLQNGFWLVLGENGSGKTNLTEAIYWILFDENTKGLSKPEMVRDRPTKQKEAIGELELVSAQSYKVCRNSKTGLEIWCDKKNLVEGMTKIQAQQFLEQNILGFDKNTYLASCYFSQEQLLTLAQLGDADTTNLVTNLLGFETYDSLYKLMDLKKKETVLQLTELEKSSVNLNNDIWKNSEQQKNLKEQIECSLKMQCSLKDEQLKVTIQIDELTTLLGSIVVPTVTTEEIDIALSALNVQKTEMSIKNKTLQETGQLKTQDLRKQLTLLQNDVNVITLQQNKIDKERSLIGSKTAAIDDEIIRRKKIVASLKENKCSYCGTILNKEELAKHIANEQQEITNLSSQIVVWNPDKDRELDSLYDQEAKILELIEDINKQISKSDADNRNLIAANITEINRIEQDIKNIQKERDATLKLAIEANSNKDSLSKQIAQLLERQLSISKQEQSITVDDKSGKLKELEDQLTVLHNETTVLKDRTDVVKVNKTIYEFWSNGFSNKGIRPLLLDKFVNDFNSVVKNYCYDVSGGEFVVQFSPTCITRAGLERNKLGLEICYKDKIVNYASLSGGEKTRANLPLCFGLNKWISHLFGIKDGILGIVILDEMFCWTDDKFRDNVADMLNNEGKNRSIFAIDHNPTLSNYTDKIWNVSKSEEITQLEIV